MAAKTTKANSKTSSRAVQKPASKKSVKAPVKQSAPVAKVAAKKVAPAVEKKPLKVKKSYVALLVGIVLVGAALYFLRGLFVAAVVNGQPVSRWEVIKQAEKQVGKQTLSNLVRNSLIEQEAQKQGVKITDKEIDAEMKKLEDNLSKQGQKLDQVLSVQGMTREDLKRLIRLDKLVAKMVGKDVKVTDKEVAEYIEKNKDLLPQDQKVEDLKKDVKERLQQQKTTEKVKSWLEDLQAKAKVIYFVQY